MLPCLTLAVIFVSSRAQAQVDPFPVISPDTKQVPVGFQGHDFVEWLRLVSKTIGSGRGQFETTGDYKIRMMAALDGLRFGTLTSKDLFAFAPRPVQEGLYDADRQVATVRVQDDTDHHDDPRSIASAGEMDFLIGEVTTLNDVYAGQNAFGVGADVSREKRVRLGIQMRDMAPKNKAWCARSGVSPDGLAFSFPLPLDKAKIALNRLRAIYLVNIDIYGPFLGIDKYDRKPTISEPYDLEYINFIVKAVPKSVLIYDPQTGEVVFNHIVKN